VAAPQSKAAAAHRLHLDEPVLPLGEEAQSASRMYLRLPSVGRPLSKARKRPKLLTDQQKAPTTA